MKKIEMSAVYKADQPGFHMDAKANAIFAAHGGQFVDQGTFYGGPHHLRRNITYDVPAKHAQTVRAALEQAGFSVTVDDWSVPRS
jgi:hypothetical protein